MTTPIIAVIGDGHLEPGDPKARFAEELGRRIVDQGWRVQTGGLHGVMLAASRGGRSSSHWVHGRIIGVLPSLDPQTANSFVDVAIPTDLGHGRNLRVVQADAVVAIGGGAGTLSELAMAWITDRPMIARRGDGWAGQLADTQIDARARFSQMHDDRVFGADDPSEVLTLLRHWLPIYTSMRD